MTAKQNPAVRWLGKQREAMLTLLEEIVNIDSGSYNKAGVDAVGGRLEHFFAEQCISVSWHWTGGDFGDALMAYVGEAEGSSKPILLMGHRDTVFPQGEAARRPFRIVGSRAYGPGVADMKAGLVMNAFVLAAYHKFGGAPGPLIGLFTGDEEIGSPSSRAIIEKMAHEARAVFNSEPGRPSGNVVTGRKGSVFMLLEVFGKAAHSGGNFQEGINANAELAHKIISLHALTDLDRGITVNVGMIAGGQSVNTTSPYAQAQIDLRYLMSADLINAMSQIKAIVNTVTIPGTSARLDIKGEFDTFVQNEGSKTLFDVYQSTLQEIGVTVEGEFSGGSADSGLTASMGCPTLCGVGPVGGKFHAPEEYVEIETIVPRAQGLALTIGRL